MPKIRTKSLQQIFFCASILLSLFLSSNASAQNLYSRASANWDAAGTWYSNAGRTIPFIGTPSFLNTLNIGAGHTITFQSGSSVTVAGIVVNDNAAGGTFLVGNGTTAGTALTITGDLVINAGGTFHSGATAATLHTVNLQGNLINGNVFDLTANAATNQTFAFTATANKLISGAGGTFNFRNLTMNTGSSSTITTSTNFSIAGVLNFNANGLLIVGASNNITMAATASNVGSSALRYIQVDGTSGTNSQVLRVNSGATADWQFLFPIGTATGGYSPVDLSAATVSVAPTLNSTLAVKAIYNPSVIGELRRTFRLVIAGNGNATTITNGKFTYANPSTPDISQGDVLANYTTIWFLNLSTATWSTLAGTAPGATFFQPSAATSLTTGTYYYTIGNSTAYPSTWYSYQTGVWSNPDVWTLDPSGTSLNNPLTTSPAIGDRVVILNGFKITCDVNNISVATTTIEGGATLDVGTSTSQNLGTVSGAGLLRVSGVGLPAGIYNSFVTAITGGTVEFYNSTGTIPVPGTNPVLPQPTYNNLLLSNSTGSAIIFTLASNLTINNNLNVTQTSGAGTVTWQINNTAAASRTITIAGDLIVSANAKITAGTGNAGSTTQHSLTITGNLTNAGVIQFFDPTDANLVTARYTTASSPNVFTNLLQGNAVNVTFNGTANKIVTCNNQTDFYRLIMSKGTGQQAMLTVNSSATGNFRLFGPNNRASTASAPNFVGQNSLSIQNGTLQLTGNIIIPSLAEEVSGNTDGFPIPQNGALWLNGNVTINVSVLTGSTANDNGRRILLSGLLKISNGSFTTGVGTGSLGFTKGISAEDDGSLVITGGSIVTSHLRTRSTGVNNFAYNQSGGTVNVGSISGIDTGFARFDLQFTTCTFIMSGGILNVSNPTNFTPSGIRIGSAASSYSVTGGTINANATTNTGVTTFDITSTAPLFNLNISRSGSGGATTAQLTSSLVVLNNLALIDAANDPTFTTGTNNLTVGGNFDIQNGTTFTPGANTLTFNGAGAQSWTHNGTISSLNNIVVNKSAGILTLGGANVFPNIVGLTLTNGTLNDGGKLLTVTTTLSNSATHTGTGSISHSAGGASTIGGTNGTFGNLTITTNATVATSGTQSVTGDLRLIGTNSSLNIASFPLTVLGNIYSDAATGVAFTGTKRILTNGLRNDGGLTRKATSTVDLLFPVGTALILYTPTTINATATTAGTISVQPVTGTHPNVTSSAHGLRYFWRVSSAGFVGLTAVSHKNYTFSTAVLDPTITTYTPARYDPSTYTWAYRTATYNATATTAIPNFNTGTAWTGLAADKLDGEYTAGNIIAFGTVTVYYSRGSGLWSVPATWSTISHAGAAAGSAPCATCPVEVGNTGFNHTVTADVNGQSAGSLYIDVNSVLDCIGSTGLNFGVNTTGTGKLRISSGVFPSGDFTNFLSPTGGTVEWYGASNYTIPSVGGAPQNIKLINYNNLIISPGTGAVITMPQNNLTVYSTFTISGTGTGQVNTDVVGGRTLTLNGDFNVNSGVFNFQNGSVTTIVEAGTTTIGSAGTINLQGGGTRTHSFTTSGSIVNNGTLIFRNTNELVNLTFTGTAAASFTGSTGGATTTLNQLIVNKGTSQTPTLTIGPLAGAVNTSSNAWLNLQNGTTVFNVSASTFILSNLAASPFTIPSTCDLKVLSGTVNVSNIASGTSDLLLSGTLEVAGGTVNVGPLATNNDNDLEYSSAGTPTIIVSSGSLYVNGSIRRPVTTIAGALAYNQSGGTVSVAGQSSDNSRGVFEIENNTGSSFSMTGASSLTVSRSTGGTTYSDLYINPATSSVAATSTIQIGANALGAQTLSVNIVPSIGNFTVLGAASNAQTVNMRSSGLTSSGTVTINTASILNTNSLNVNIGGNLNISGTYNGSNNTTTFNGSGTQNGVLTAGSTFKNITINKSAGTAFLTGPASITDLNILSGILDVTATLSVNGNITNNSAQTGSGIIALTGTSTTHTITSSSGSFTNLSLVGSGASNTVSVTGNMTINGTLTFTGASRFLYIKSNLLTFGTSATISGAAATAFVKTNGVASDLGVVRTWPVGTTSFTYAVGTLNNYTPVAMTLTVPSLGAGNLTVIPVNQRHPTYNVASTEQVLNYYWIVSRDNTLSYGTTGSHQYQYPSTLMGGSGGTLKAAYLDLNGSPLGWNTTNPSGAATTTQMTFTNSLNTNSPTTGNTFHYSVGTSNTLPNPILPVYSRTTDPNTNNPAVGGSWNNANSWTATVGGSGPALASAPTGVPVVIVAGTRINMNVNARTAFTSQINGLLVLGTSYGHNLGTVTGTGTLQTATNTFPAGNYTTFVSSSGGTIEYVAPMTMNSRSTYNNLKVSGTGAVVMTNTDLVLNGGVNISTASVTLDNSANNRDITLAKDWANIGTFNAGTGMVTFNGSGAQTISGTTTFNDVTISKTNNVTLTGVTTLNGDLTLTNGNIISSVFPAASRLNLSSSSSVNGGGTTSFVDGRMSKVMASGSTFTFPLGSIAAIGYRPVIIGNTGGPASDTWTTSYISHDPTTDGFNNRLFNSANMAKVSLYEYWQVACLSGTGTASLTLSFGAGSYGAADIGILTDLKTARWNGTAWDLPPGGGTFSQSGTNVAGTVTVSFQNAFSPQTLATDDDLSSLPVELISFNARLSGYAVDLDWTTASELNNASFTVQRSADIEKFEDISIVQGQGTKTTETKYFSVDKNPLSGRSYYRLKQTDKNGHFTFSEVRTVDNLFPDEALKIYPNPIAQNQFTFALNYLKPSERVILRVMNLQGSLVFETAYQANAEGKINEVVSVPTLAAGFYIVDVVSSVRAKRKIIVE